MEGLIQLGKGFYLTVTNKKVIVTHEDKKEDKTVVIKNENGKVVVTINDKVFTEIEV